MASEVADIRLLMAIGTCALFGAMIPGLNAQTIYTAAQSTQGKTVYAESCASCHGPNTDDG